MTATARLQLKYSKQSQIEGPTLFHFPPTWMLQSTDLTLCHLIPLRSLGGVDNAGVEYIQMAAEKLEGMADESFDVVRVRQHMPLLPFCFP